jgi:fructokinase
MKILAFGEILWDLFPGRKCIGGAPFNFAAHAAGLGAQAALISAVGCDALGEEARRQLRAHGVSDTWVAYSSLPTGSCAVTLGPDGTPRYTLHTGVAYDAIPVPAAALEDADLFYFGTLAQRDARSRSALWRILKENRFREILCDLNIRQNFYTPEILVQSLRACTTLKLSREDAAVFTSFHWPEDEEGLCRKLAADYEIGTVVLTLDADGAMVYERSTDRFFRQAAPKTEVVSAVGAGDSFAACFCICRLRGETTETALAKAVKLSAFVVSRTEAIPAYPPELSGTLDFENR